jgi:hypothetical protein
MRKLAGEDDENVMVCSEGIHTPPSKSLHHERGEGNLDIREGRCWFETREKTEKIDFSERKSFWVSFSCLLLTFEK